MPIPPSEVAEAKYCGLPGMTFSGARTWGTIFSLGWIVQPESPPSASDALMSLRKFRRLTGSFNSAACSGNSRWTMAANSSVWANWSKLRQYSWP